MDWRCKFSAIARVSAIAALVGLSGCVVEERTTYVAPRQPIYVPQPPPQPVYPIEYYRYYYYPDAGVYYHIETHYYYYFFNGAWQRSPNRPKFIYLDDRRRTVIEITDEQPYARNHEHQRQYGAPRPERFNRGPGPGMPEGQQPDTRQSGNDGGWPGKKDSRGQPRAGGQDQGQQPQGNGGWPERKDARGQPQAGGQDQGLQPQGNGGWPERKDARGQPQAGGQDQGQQPQGNGGWPERKDARGQPQAGEQNQGQQPQGNAVWPAKKDNRVQGQAQPQAGAPGADAGQTQPEPQGKPKDKLKVKLPVAPVVPPPAECPPPGTEGEQQPANC